MLGLLKFAAVLAAAPTLAPNETGLSNPRAAELFERDPALMAWALRRFDANGDGWLTSFEASHAADEFRALADTDHDGRVTMTEYRDATAYIAARY
jgi:hypothetical protein